METSVVPCQHQKKKRSAPRPSGDLFPFLKRPIPSLGTEQGDGGQKAPEYLQDELRRSVFAILANLPPFDPLPSFGTYFSASLLEQSHLILNSLTSFWHALLQTILG